MHTRLLTTAFIAVATVASAQRPDPIENIREADIKRDLFALASDAMRGREAGTLDEMTASAWVAERAREAGLLPAGDNGTVAYVMNRHVEHGGIDERGIAIVRAAYEGLAAR